MGTFECGFIIIIDYEDLSILMRIIIIDEDYNDLSLLMIFP